MRYAVLLFFACEYCCLDIFVYCLLIFSNASIIAQALAVITVILISTFPGWHDEVDDNGSEREVRPFPSQTVVHSACGAAIAAVFFDLVAVLWQHIGAVAGIATAQHIAYGSVDVKIGATAMALGWLSFAFLVAASVGLLVTALSIAILDLHIDD